ncbi:tRNA-dihydrouridine synthase [Oscillibacter sp.]|uniref:tRNA dihydrouridine synthase n=1 Tax=Oscillibacter sp. TaxID=1945593 RepID=UPI003394CE25
MEIRSLRVETAPLEGITTWLFRRTHFSMFGGVDRYFTPFFSPVSEHILTAKDLRDLSPENNRGIPTVPQVMTKRAEDFLWAAEQARDLGFEEVNLNLGCPSGTVTAKGKGAGFLLRPDELDAFFDVVFSKVCLPVSVKTRIGFHDVEEFGRLLEIFNCYPIRELIVHPRLRGEFYKGPVHLDAFAAALESSRAPVTYNGDLVTLEDLTAFSERFPAVNTVMIGRGVIADPALLRKLRGGAAATREELQTYTQTLYQGYRAAYGYAGTAAQRMKELWFYLINLFDDGEKYAKKMRRVGNAAEYEHLEAGIFRDLNLLTQAHKPLDGTGKTAP